MASKKLIFALIILSSISLISAVVDQSTAWHNTQKIATSSSNAYTIDQNSDGVIDKGDSLSEPLIPINIDTSKNWHPLQQISISSSNLNSVDENANGWPDVCASLSEPSLVSLLTTFFEPLSQISRTSSNMQSVDSNNNGWPDKCDCILSETATDNNNCGTCGNVCGVGTHCEAGSCVIDCAPSCVGKCAGESDGCGGICPNPCGTQQTCISGVCYGNCRFGNGQYVAHGYEKSMNLDDRWLYNSAEGHYYNGDWSGSILGNMGFTCSNGRFTMWITTRDPYYISKTTTSPAGASYFFHDHRCPDSSCTRWCGIPSVYVCHVADCWMRTNGMYCYTHSTNMPHGNTNEGRKCLRWDGIANNEVQVLPDYTVNTQYSCGW